MTRRNLIKNLFAIGSLSIAGIGIYEWYRLKHPFDFKFIDANKLLIAELTETIIPRTDTPGAKDAKVDEYIIYAVKNNLSDIERNVFIDGLSSIQSFCKNKFGKTYDKCSEPEKIAALKSTGDNFIFRNFSITKKIRTKFISRGFLDILKDLTVVGYCTSEIGATKGLVYDDIPVHYLPCVPLEKNQKSWATK
jgi:hypothetical protein